MILDLVVAGLLLAFAVVGAVTGALAQAARLGAVLASGVLGRPVGALLAPGVASALGVPPVVGNILATSAAFVGLYVLLHLAGRLVARRLTRNQEIRAVDRGAGALLGAAKTFLFLWVLLSALVFLEKPVERFGFRWGGGQGSFFAALARDANFFSSFSLPAAPRLPAPGSTAAAGAGAAAGALAGKP